MKGRRGFRLILRIFAACMLCMLCSARAFAEEAPSYGFDGEGTYYLTGAQLGSSLSCREGSDSVTLVSGRLSEKTTCTRFSFVSCGGNVYAIRPDFGADAYLCTYDYGNRLILKKSTGSIPAEGRWRVIPDDEGVVIVNVLTGEYLSLFGTNVTMKAPDEVKDAAGRASTRWMAVKTAAYGTQEGSAVREFTVEEKAVSRSVTKSSRIPVSDLFGFSWGPLAEADDFVYTTDRADVLGVAADGTIAVVSKGEATITARHRYSGQKLTALIRVCNNGIVIVPGFMGSELVNRSGEKIWSESLLNELSEGISLSALSRFSALSSPTGGDGVRAVDNYFGALDLYKDLYRTLARTYGADYALEFYEYDWRRSSVESGAELARYLESCNYDEVILIGHSFGGLVCAQAIAESSWVAEHTALACMVSVPTCGSLSLVEAWANNRFGNALGLGSFSSIENSAIRKIVGTLPSVYEMLPSRYAVETLGVIGGCSSYQSFLDACAESCGSFDKSLARAAADATDRIMRNGTLSLSKVPVVWYGGIGMETVDSASLSGKKFSFTEGEGGDGIVSVAECLAGSGADKKDAVTAVERHLWIADDPGVIDDIVRRIAECFATE